MKQPQLNTHTNNVLDTDKIGSLLIKLSIPAFLGMFVQTLYNVINTIFVGHYVGPLGIAGLSIAMPLQMLGMGMGMMVGVGGMSIISRYIGERRHGEAEKALGNGITVGIVLSVVVFVVILTKMDYWLALIGASEEVLPYARDYLAIMMYALIFQVFATTFVNFTRAEGNSRVGMVAMMAGAAVNIGFDVIFIIVLDMGVRGAGWATFLAQLVSLIIFAFYYGTGNSYLKIRFRNLKPDFAILKAMFAIGIGAFAQTFASSLSAMLVIKSVVEYGGDYALGAFGIIQRVLIFAIMPAMVLGQGAQPILGFNYGAKRYGLALKAINMTILTATVLSLSAFFLVYFIPEPIFRIFTDDPELIKVGVNCAKLMFLGMPLIGLIMVGTMIFQALGKAVPAFIVSVARPVVFLIPFVMILPRHIGLNGVWLSFPVSDVLTFLLIVFLVFPILAQFRKAAAEEKRIKVNGTQPEQVTASAE